MATAFWDDAKGQRSGFWASGHVPTLIAAFLYFDLALMVWVKLVAVLLKKRKDKV